MATNAHQPAYRILDACANRATEGIRTIEECARFTLQNLELALAAKSLRHDLAAAISRLSRHALLSARDTEADVGTGLRTETEYRRMRIADVVAAAAERVQQSMRVMEEYGKLIDVDFAYQIESLRYRAYTLFRDIELQALSGDRSARLTDAVLYLLITCQSTEEEFVATIRERADAGVDILQLRDKQATDRMLFERACIGATVAEECGVLFIINDRADIARAAAADGVHVGQNELPVAAARRILGGNSLVGVSTHTMDQVHQAIADGADYIGCGPTFASTTKSFASQAGTEFLRAVHQATKATPRPAFAIGGIDLTNVDQVVAAGFHRIAVSAAINDATDPSSAARGLRDRLTLSKQWPETGF